jgi:hypothetical protein
VTHKNLIEQYIDEDDVKEYSELKRMLPRDMDERCILGLHSLPEDICYAAVRRLHAIKTAGRELTEQEISVLPGCPWAIQHQRSHYCFFKYLSDYIKESSPSEQEMAYMLHCAMQDIKSAEKSAISKIKTSDLIESLKRNFDTNEIVEGREVNSTFTVLR